MLFFIIIQELNINFNSAHIYSANYLLIRSNTGFNHRFAYNLHPLRSAEESRDISSLVDKGTSVTVSHFELFIKLDETRCYSASMFSTRQLLIQ